MCERLVGVMEENNYKIVSQNEYDEKKSTLNSRQLKFINNMKYYLSGYKCSTKVPELTNPVFILPIE